MHLDLWTLALQAINLLVLLGLLRWLFYRPLLAVIEARRQAVQQEQAQAEAARQQAEASLAQLAAQQAAAETAREQLLQAARQQASAESEASALAAKVATEQCLREAQARIARERQQATQALFNEASGLAVQLARRLLSQSPSADVSLLQTLLERLAQTPAEERQTWFAEDSPRSVTLRSAAPLTAPARADAEARLAALLGPGLVLHFETEPSLLAGAELCFAHGTLALSWAAELKAAELQLQQIPHPATAPEGPTP